MSLSAVLQKLYRQVPVVRELGQLRELVLRQNEALDALRPARFLAAEEALGRHPRYGDPRRLHAAGYQSFSQNDEDGMIAETFRRIGAPNRTFVEIGVGDGAENNTRLLLHSGWRGWWCEGSARAVAGIRRRFPGELADGRLQLCAEMLSPATVADLLAGAGVPTEPDFLGIDIDQHTYHVWAALPALRPRVLVVEYNATFRPPIEWVTPVDAPPWDGSRDFGASLSACERLARSRGYALVGCDFTGINAFFVRADLVGDQFLAPFDAATHYEPPRYGLRGHGVRARDTMLQPRIDPAG
ncbi:MAG: hypothetical protein HZA93_15235 [Verrucomicrobia bacterium]|nr:hypothetical protein [Verrucomicrobiota bacterium]